MSAPPRPDPSDRPSKFSPWQQEVAKLPGWTQKIVRGLVGMRSHGLTANPLDETKLVLFIETADNKQTELWDGLGYAMELADAITAPWPPPKGPAREKRTLNVVELVDDEGGFDQPCAFGNRVGSHAVYCHNTDWPSSPRKCRRSRYDTDYLHEDCPGFVSNPDSVE